MTANENKPGKVITVCSAKGGIGRTVLTVNVAVALSKKNMQISILDGYQQFGDVGLAMDLQSRFTMKDVIDNFDGMDADSFSGHLSTHESGVKVLPAPDKPEYAELVTDSVVGDVLDWLKENNDYVLVDTAAGLQEGNLFLLEKSDLVLVVTDLVMPALKNTKLMLETLNALGMKDKVRVVVNRSTMESVIHASDVSGILGVENLFYIPNDFKTVSQSLNIGVPFVMSKGKTELAKAVFKMAEQLTSGERAPEAPSKNKSLFPKLFSKKEKNR
ncbi:MAG TPA: AAA family ATPase [Bacillales bacterium]|nr:AAA family ATPase [Bacillales bacterium]